MHPLWNRGFAIESAALGGMAAAGAGAGWLLARAVLELATAWLDIGALVMTSPVDAFVIRLKLAVALAAPSLVAWVAVLVHRVRAEAGPPPRWLAAYVALPWLAGLSAAALRLAWVAQALDAAGTYDVEPMIAATEVAPGSWAMRGAVVVGVLLWTGAALLAPRLREREAPPAAE